jgi:predicted ATPase
MIIDLSGVEVFDSEEIDFDKRNTFVFGKNGTGKSTITEELRK